MKTPTTIEEVKTEYYDPHKPDGFICSSKTISVVQNELLNHEHCFEKGHELLEHKKCCYCYDL